MTKTKFTDLQDAIHAYGQAAFKNLLRSKALAHAIARGFPEHINCPAQSVALVPPEGTFDPRHDYDDGAFSFHNRDVIILEPISFGISLIVGNAEDSGALWLRTVVSVEIVGDGFDVFVAGRPRLRAPFAYEDALEPVYEAIYKEFLETFTKDVMDFHDKRFKTGIGFMPS